MTAHAPKVAAKTRALVAANRFPDPSGRENRAAALRRARFIRHTPRALAPQAARTSRCVAGAGGASGAAPQGEGKAVIVIFFHSFGVWGGRCRVTAGRGRPALRWGRHRLPSIRTRQWVLPCRRALREAPLRRKPHPYPPRRGRRPRRPVPRLRICKRFRWLKRLAALVVGADDSVRPRPAAGCRLRPRRDEPRHLPHHSATISGTSTGTSSESTMPEVKEYRVTLWWVAPTTTGSTVSMAAAPGKATHSR